jgi:HK97 family phage portal protein
VLACVRRISEALMCPCKVYSRSANGDRKEERAHPLYDVLSVQPNEFQSGLEYRETIGLHLALTFNHFSYISKVRGKVTELLPIPPEYVAIEYGSSNAQGLSYTINWPDGRQTKDLTSDEIWHIRGPSWDGRVGMDAIRLLRESIGLAIATEETHARYHSNGAQPGGILSTEKDISKQEVRDKIREAFNQNVGGVQNRFRTIVLDNGFKWEAMSPTGVESQHLQLRQFQVEEICRAYCIMPIMVGYSGDKAPTFASSEQLFLAHLVHTVRPWHHRVAESADRWLLSKEDRTAGNYIGFVEADFMSPDMKTKAEYYTKGLGGGSNPGWLTIDDVRGFEDLPKIVGGDNIYAPSNAGPIDEDGIPQKAEVTPPPTNTPPPEPGA